MHQSSGLPVGHLVTKSGPVVSAEDNFEIVLRLSTHNEGVIMPVQWYSHVRRFKVQAQNFFARPSSCSAWPLLGKAGGRIMKRRLIML